MSVRKPARSTSLTHAYFMKCSRTRLPAWLTRCVHSVTARFTSGCAAFARVAERLREVEHAEAQVIDPRHLRDLVRGLRAAAAVSIIMHTEIAPLHASMYDARSAPLSQYSGRPAPNERAPIGAK